MSLGQTFGSITQS